MQKFLVILAILVIFFAVYKFFILDKKSIDITQQGLKDRKEEFAKTAPEAIQKAFLDGIEAVKQSGVLQKAANVGDIAPNIDYIDIEGKKFNLKEALKEGPVIITWYRGGWCPYCNIYLRGLDNFAKNDAKKYNATIVALSPEKAEKAIITANKGELDLTIISDVGNKIASQYNITYKLPTKVKEIFDTKFALQDFNGDNSAILPLSATYVIGTDGIIKFAHLDADYRNRATFKAIIDSLK